MKVIRECGRARNAQGWRKLGPRGLCGNSNLGQPPYIYICVCVCICVYIYMCVCVWKGPLCIEWRGLGKKHHKTYNNCPKVNFDFICCRSTLSHFHLASEDLNYYSIRKASLKSDLLIHLLFNVSLNSWVHFLWLSFKFAVRFILASRLCTFPFRNLNS